MNEYKLDQEKTITTDSGATFKGSKDWYIKKQDNTIILQDPERELAIAFIENREPTAQEAVKAAWQKFQPNFAYHVEQSSPGLVTDGWDEVLHFEYHTPGTQDLFVIALAHRKDTTWYIQLFNGTRKAFDRRMSQAAIAMTSFKPHGAQEESFAGKQAHKLDKSLIDQLVTFIEYARKEFKIPGVALGIVQEGKIIFERGFGQRTLGSSKLVTPKTLFMIGSTTKALTSFMMAQLVDQGVFDWDTPITEIMPAFKLGNESITKQLLIKHMISANTGMPRQDIEFILNYANATAESRLKEMSSMIPTTGFGETFQYSNGMVSAAGYIAAHSVYKDLDLGSAYDFAMKKYVFDPIGMESTTFDFHKVEQENYASPHGLDLRFNFVPLSVFDEHWVISIRPAGGAWSTVHDMSEYLITELNNGINSVGNQVISKKNLLKRRDPQIKITDKISYGLALMAEDDHGVLSIGHNGGTMGFSSLMFFLPEYKVGMVMLTNVVGGHGFTTAVKRHFMELLFDGKPESQDMVTLGLKQLDDEKKKYSEKINLDPDRVWIHQLLGTYKNESLGTITLKLDGAKAIIDAGEWKSVVAQKKESDGTLKLILADPAPCVGLEFLPQEHEGRKQLIVEKLQHKYVFEKVKGVNCELKSEGDNERKI